MQRRSSYAFGKINTDADFGPGFHRKHDWIAENRGSGWNSYRIMPFKSEGLNRFSFDLRRISRERDGSGANQERRRTAFIGKAKPYLISADRHANSLAHRLIVNVK